VGKGGAKEQAKIIIKQSVRQEQNVRKSRKKRVTFNEKGVIRKRRAEYNALKKAVKKRLVLSKKQAFKAENERIKTLPAKERKTARSTLRATHKAKLTALLKQMPGVGKKSLNELTTLVRLINKLKW